MIDKCPECVQPNTTLQWHERKGRWVCLPCFAGRRKEQDNIEKHWLKLHPLKINEQNY